MDDTLYDEFGNYIGPELDDSDEDEDLDAEILKVTRSAMAEELAETKAEIELAKKEKRARELARRIADTDAAGSSAPRGLAVGQSLDIAAHRGPLDDGVGG